MYIRKTGDPMGTPIIFLHGFLETGNIWFPWAEQMAETNHLFIPDLPGHGKTKINSQEARFSDWSRMLIRAIDAQSETRKSFHLVGHSMGGYLAMEIAALFPQRIGKVVMLHSTPMPDTPRQIVSRKKQIHLIQKGRRQLLMKRIGLSMFAPNHCEKLSETAKALNLNARECTGEGMIGTLNAIMNRRNFVPVMKQIMTKTLFITGGQDPFMPANYYQAILELFPGLRHHHFPKSGHAAFLEEPDAAYKVVTNFLEV
jgi:pimeloyl-ACP methyl ester carboxylesterase